MPIERVPRDQVVKRLAADNPWWASGTLPAPFENWRPRPYLDLFYPLLRQTEVNRALVLLGPRRVGKTVMIHHAVRELIRSGIPPRNVCYFTVDHPIYTGLSVEELLTVYSEAVDQRDSNQLSYVFFDEIQYLRSWERHVKALVDRFPSVRVTVSGSAAAALKLASTESGAGRFTDFLLPPLTFHEFLFLRNEQDLVSVTEREDGKYVATRDIGTLNERFLEYINYGGYPEVVLSPAIQSDPGRYLKSDVVDKVLLRDLPTLYGIEDIQELNSLFATLALSTGNELSLEQISQYSGVAKATIKRYIEYLEAAFLIRRVDKVRRSTRKFERARTFKVYLTNTAMRTALFSRIENDDPAFPHLVETAVFSQFFHDDSELVYARWESGEIDLIELKPPGVGRVVEIKWSDRVVDRPEEIRSVLEFCAEHEVRRAVVTTRSVAKMSRIGATTVVFFPAALFAYVAGFAIVRGKIDKLNVG